MYERRWGMQHVVHVSLKLYAFVRRRWHFGAFASAAALILYITLV
jgi:hypothetical protein